MTDVHDAAARGYEKGATTYAGGRPDYPPEAVAWLTEVLALSAGKAVLDLGAGTGKFLASLRQTGARLLALEPVAAMRARLSASNGDVEILSGSAEHIPLADAALDAVVCAQSFHWFATAAALDEIRRVLRPGGTLGLIWNVRDETVSWVAKLSEITDPFEAGTPRYRTGAWKRVFPADGFELIEERCARHTHVGSVDRVIVQRTLSVSFIAALPSDARQEIVQKLSALIASTPELADRDMVTFPYETRMVAYRKPC
jgi:SAM-dependent methyltransferase